MANWFGKEGYGCANEYLVCTNDYVSSRGLIFGVWSACASVGNIIGAALAATFLRFGYEYTFLVCSILLFCFAIICFFGIVPSPDDLGLNDRMALHLHCLLSFSCRLANKRCSRQRGR